MSLSDDLLNWSFIKEGEDEFWLWFWPTAIVQTFVVFVLLPIEWIAKKVLGV